MEITVSQHVLVVDAWYYTTTFDVVCMYLSQQQHPASLRTCRGKISTYCCWICESTVCCSPAVKVSGRLCFVMTHREHETSIETLFSLYLIWGFRGSYPLRPKLPLWLGNGGWLLQPPGSSAEFLQPTLWSFSQEQHNKHFSIVSLQSEAFTCIEQPQISRLFIKSLNQHIRTQVK